MSGLILAINAGSSSLKISVFIFRYPDPLSLAEVQIAGLAAPQMKLKYIRNHVSVKDSRLSEVNDQESALKYILDRLVEDEGLPEIKDKKSFRWACHRIVHGGDSSEPQVINNETMRRLEALSNLAPL